MLLPLEVLADSSLSRLSVATVPSTLILTDAQSGSAQAPRNGKARDSSRSRAPTAAPTGLGPTVERARFSTGEGTSATGAEVGRPFQDRFL
eukprot:scaffold164898_cov36-Tisochrysis_lutea.AAC.2